MATQPTQNPVPSESPRDLKFNAGKIDEFATSLALQYQDRFGNQHYTIEGLRWLAQQAISQYGWITVGTFQAGAEITLPNEILKDEVSGEYYRWDGALPKSVPTGSTPDSSGGISVGAWVSVGDSSLRSDLISGDSGRGSKIINAKVPIQNSQSLTLQRKLRELVSIADGTGTQCLPDGSMDCSASLTSLVSAGHRYIKLPFVLGSANIYYFSAFEPNDLQNVTFDVDTGVTLSVPDDALVGRPTAVFLNFIKDTKFFFRSINSSYLAYSSRSQSFLEKDNFLESTSYDYSSVLPLLCNSQLTPLSVPFNSDAWLSSSFTFSDASQANFTVATGNNTLYYAAYNAKPGDKLSSYIAVSATPYIIGVVRTTSGYYALKAYTSQDGSGLTIVTKLSGVTATEVAVNVPMQGNHPAYSAVNSEWSIKINSYTNFDICFNGFVVYSTSTTGFIIDAGFGGYFQSGLSNATVNIINPVVTKNAAVNASRFLAIKIFGDSVSSSRYDYWPGYMKKELELSSGVRAWNIIDSAVAGQTSSQQLAIMQSQGVADANLVIIAVGTNDAQGQVDFNTYTSNLNAMIDICVNANKTVILAKFGLWYTRNEAGSRGQASANAEKAARYRGIAARVAAQRSVKLIDLTEFEGPIVSFYVNPNSALNMVGLGDSIVHDNIHPTSLATKLIGRRMAQAVMGVVSTKNTFAISSALIASPANNWSINANDNPLYADISHEGIIVLSGTIFRSTGTTSDGTTIFTIPKSMSPKSNLNIMVYSDQSATLKVVIGTNGQAKIYGWTTANYLSLSGVSWSVK